MVFLMLTPFMFFACGGPDDEEIDSEGEKIPAGTITGVAQKGQFIKGSSITIYSMDEDLNSTGLSYPSQTLDDMGSFTVSNVDASYIDVKANGYYYNENKGKTSESTIYLQAVAKSGSKVNVNLLTTLAYNRIKYLVRTGLSFSDAQNRAQIEVLTALGLGNSAPSNFTEMNIAGSGDANGLLLAASLLIQQNRSVGDVSKLISDIAADLEEDGILSSELNQEIHRYERQIYIGDVIYGLLSFYKKNNVEDFSIPTFYNFLDTDGDRRMDGKADGFFKYIGYSDVYYTDPMDLNQGYSAEGFSTSLTYLSTNPFDVKSDADWLSAKKRTITENIYAVDIAAQPNTGENRTAHVTYTDNSGKVLITSTYQQKAPENKVPQRIMFEYYNLQPNTTNMIGINGKSYEAKPAEMYASYPARFWYVDIPSEDRKDRYQLYYPTTLLSMPNGYGTFKLTIPSTLTSDDFPIISQIEGNEYNPMSNPMNASIIPACPSILVYGSLYAIDYLVLTSVEPIFGSLSIVLNKGYIDYENTKIIEEGTPDEDGLYRIKVQVSHHDDNELFYVPILKDNVPVAIQCYNSAGQLISGSEQYSRYQDVSRKTR